MKFVDRITCNWIPCIWFKSVGYFLVCDLPCKFYIIKVKYVTPTCNNPFIYDLF